MTSLFITDLDDTLLVDGRLTNNSRKHLEIILNRHDIMFSVASARNVHSIKTIFETLDIKCPIITFGGAFISDLQSSRHLLCFSIGIQIVEEILNTIRSYSLDPLLYLYDTKSGIDTIYYHTLTNHAMEWCIKSDSYFKEQHFAFYSHINDISLFPIVRMILKDKRKTILSLCEELNAKYSDKINIFTYPSWYIDGYDWLIILSKDANKLNAIKELVNYTGVLEENVTYYGDSLNDLCVFQSEIKSIAVSNSIDEIKSIADMVIGSNKANSVTTHILKTITCKMGSV